MKELHFGDTFGRSASIGLHSEGNGDQLFYVAFTDWTTRQGGSVARISLGRAKELATAFIRGCSYTFDSQVGIVLNNAV